MWIYAVAFSLLTLLLTALIALVVSANRKLIELQKSISSLDNQQKNMLEILSREVANANQNIAIQFSAMNSNENQRWDSFAQQLATIHTFNESKFEAIRKTLDEGLFRIHRGNDEKLEKMRATVEEKLQSTLEQRLNSSFKLVSERLDIVHRGLGEMRNLASGVGDLKKVLSNIKTRGIWGEVQLEALLQQMLSPEQYAKNAQVNPEYNGRVEFALRLPGKEEREVWMPIDAKFPLEDYQKLVAAEEVGDLAAVAEYNKAIETSIRLSAQTIAAKYLHPPHTTDFAIMFIPLEALYAEILRKPGLIESLQSTYRVMVTGPTTLGAILNSLQMGFKTLAIEKRSSEVWQVLGVVKTEFLKFADILSKTKIKLDQASRVIEDAEAKTRTIGRKLRDVEAVSNDSSPLIDEITTEDAA